MPQPKGTLLPGQGHRFSLGFIEARVLIEGASAGDAFALVEATLAPMTLAGPLHLHERESGWFYVLDGELGIQVGEAVVEADAGALVFAPSGVAHTYWNRGSRTARYLEAFAPAGLDRYYAELSEILASGSGLDRVLELSKAYGLQFQLESIPMLMERHGVRMPGLDDGEDHGG